MREKKWIIGRKSIAKADILFNEETISAKHAVLKFEDGKFFIIDNNSTNGSYVVRNDMKVSLKNFMEVLPSDFFVFGNYKLSSDELISKAIQDDPDNMAKQEKTSGKIIRCAECFNPIDSNDICPSCKCDKHLKER
jgi:pSer/pThr/pTyr-binding forkhead associated (FHA) protein